MIIDDKNEILRIKALEILSNEVKRLMNLIDSRENETKEFNKEIINNVKNIDIKTIKQKRNLITIPNLIIKPTHKILPQTIKNTNDNQFSMKSISANFFSFFNWVRDDYRDIKPIPIKPMSDKPDEVSSKIDDIPNQTTKSNSIMPKLFLGAGGGIALSHLSKPEVKPINNIESNKKESETLKQDLKVEFKAVGIDTESKNIDSKYSNITTSKLDTITDKSNMGGHLLSSTSMAFKNDITNKKEGGIAEVKIDFANGTIDLYRHKTHTPSKDEKFNQEDIKASVINKFDGEYKFKDDTTTFNYFDFLGKFKEVSFNRIKTYYAFGDKKLWENDKEVISDEMNIIFGKTKTDKIIIKQLLVELFNNVDKSNPNDTYSSNENDKWILSLKDNTVSSSQAISNQLQYESSNRDYDILQRKYNEQTISFVPYDTSSEIAVNDIIKAYNMWETSAFAYYHTWGESKSDRLKKLDYEFSLFWKRLSSKIKSKDLSTIYSMIRNTKYSVLRSNFFKRDKDEKILTGKDLIGGLFSNINRGSQTTDNTKQVSKDKSLYSITQSYLKAKTGNYRDVFIDSSNSLGGIKNDVLANLIGMSQEAMNEGIINGKIPINSAYRDYSAQVVQWNRNFRNGKLEASLPFVSPHAFGIAIDINRDILDKFDKSGLMKKWHFSRPYMKGNSESWHLQSTDYTDEYNTGITAGDNSKFIALKTHINSNPSDNFEIPTNLDENGVRSFLLAKYDEIIGRKNTKEKSKTTTKTDNTQIETNKTMKSDEIIEEVSQLDVYESEVEPQQYQ